MSSYSNQILLGVVKATISRCLNNRPAVVVTEVKLRVRMPNYHSICTISYLAELRSAFKNVSSLSLVSRKKELITRLQFQHHGCRFFARIWRTFSFAGISQGNRGRWDGEASLLAWLATTGWKRSEQLQHMATIYHHTAHKYTDLVNTIKNAVGR